MCSTFVLHSGVVLSENVAQNFSLWFENLMFRRNFLPLLVNKTLDFFDGNFCSLGAEETLFKTLNFQKCEKCIFEFIIYIVQ